MTLPHWRIVDLSRQLLDQVLKIEAQAFQFPWNRSSYLSELTCTNALNRAILQSEKTGQKSLIAYLCSRIIIDELHIMKIAVAPEWRRCGVATALMQNGFYLARKQGAKCAILEVRTSNRAAQGFYHHNGFRLIGKRPNYYPQTGEAALIYRKSIEEDQ